MSGRRRVLVLAVLATILASIAGPVSAASPAAPKASWTIMVYMSGDNDLEGYIVKDLELELAAQGSNAQIQITALADRGPGYDKSRGDWQSTKLYHPTQGMQADAASAVADWGERNMGDPQTLKEYVAWTKANYPADHYALYFWGHGWGWHPGWTMEDSSSGSGDALDPDEVKSVQSQLGFIDVVGYDACNMAQIEVMDLWRGKATALVGSQEYVNMDGIEYDTVISQLRQDPAMSADQVAAATSASAVVEKTYSAMAVDTRYTALRNAVDAWSIALKAAVPTQRSGIVRGFSNAKSFWQAPTDKDLYDLAKQINANVTDANVKAKGTAVMNAVDAVVLHRRFTGKAYNMVHGITITGITRPVERNADWTYYKTIDFALGTGWDEFEDLLAS
jgi:DNA-binding protein